LTDIKDIGPKNNKEEDKHDMSELPLDLLSELLCPAYKIGSVHKYYRNSWREGFKISTMFAACLRHLTAFYFQGKNYDQDTLDNYGFKCHHLGNAIFCIICMYSSLINQPHLDDRTGKEHDNLKGIVASTTEEYDKLIGGNSHG